MSAFAAVVREQIVAISKQAMSQYRKDVCSLLQLGSSKMFRNSIILSFLTVLSKYKLSLRNPFMQYYT